MIIYRCPQEDKIKKKEGNIMMKWQTALTTNPSIANAVGMLLDIIDNCDFQMDGAPMDDGKHIIGAPDISLRRNEWLFSGDDSLLVAVEFVKFLVLSSDKDGFLYLSCAPSVKCAVAVDRFDHFILSE